MKIKIYQDESEEYRWRVVASNGRTIGASSEGYTRRSDCVTNMLTIGSVLGQQLLMTYADRAEIDEE